MNYFKIRVKAGSPEELKRKVADHKKRGFELVDVKEKESCELVYLNNKYKGVNLHKGYVAFMRRPNHDRVTNEAFSV